MSTTLYLRCVTHDPYISSDEVGYNLSYLEDIRKTILNRDVIVQNMSVLGGDAYDLHSHNDRKRRLWWFLFNHPECDLEIWDEYGQKYPLMEEPKSVDWKYEFMKCDSIEEAIGVAIGAASGCWENLEGAGEFQSDRAKEISEALVEVVRDYSNTPAEYYDENTLGKVVDVLGKVGSINYTGTEIASMLLDKGIMFRERK